MISEDVAWLVPVIGIVTSYIIERVIYRLRPDWFRRDTYRRGWGYHFVISIWFWPVGLLFALLLVSTFS